MGRNWITICVSVLASIILTLAAGCESDAQTGALVGTGVGALAGQAIGRDTEGTLIGAAVGGGAGYIIGNEQDKKKAASQPGTYSQQTGIVTVNVTNSNGSVTPVKLKKQGANYVGPKGEYYDHLPGADELKPVYGF